MSNQLSIAAVTATLRKLIEDGIKLVQNDATVVTQPPDKIEHTNNLVNLFLYQTTLNAAWRNQDMPRQVKAGETAQPPLALNLYYLLTAYGKGDDAPDPVSHRLLGSAMSVLYDHPVLSAEDILAALPVTNPPQFDLFNQIERVRITHQPLSLDEMSKLWTIFQTNYRISTAYEVSVVLIDSNRSSRTPLPVLTRGPEDRGVDALGSLVSPYPTLTELVLPTTTQPGLQPGEQLIIRGHHLNCDSMVVRFSHPRLETPLETPPLAGVSTTGTTDINVTLPDDLADRTNFLSGFYTVSIIVTRNSEPTNKVRTTNELSFSVVPQILTINPTTSASAGGDFTLTLTCNPQVLPEQRASLLFGGSEVLADAHPSKTGTLTFRIAPVDASSKGEYFVRLRVDGVDSLVVDYTHTPPVFDNSKKVVIT